MERCQVEINRFLPKPNVHGVEYLQKKNIRDCAFEKACSPSIFVSLCHSSCIFSTFFRCGLYSLACFSIPFFVFHFHSLALDRGAPETPAGAHSFPFGLRTFRPGSHIGLNSHFARSAHWGRVYMPRVRKPNNVRLDPDYHREKPTIVLCVERKGCSVSMSSWLIQVSMIFWPIGEFF